MHTSLELVLILLAAAVSTVVLCRIIKLPAMLGYLLVGILIGPHALGWIPISAETSYLAEFGIVFLMFSVGLEFSLPKLNTMRKIVFGFGATQVTATILIVVAISLLTGLSWQAGLALGGAVAMSSTAIASKILAERLEVNSPHGRQIIGVLLFQDLAVVPLLIIIPALQQSSDHLLLVLGIALFKASLVLIVLLFFGHRLMRPWFHLVAKQRSSELFVINVLLITLGIAYLTELAGLSLALGAFLAGMLISETEYRYEVEEDIKPFRDLLLGLFFVTIGMKLDFTVVAQHFLWVVLILTGIVLGKLALIAGLSRLFGNPTSVSIRSGLALAQAGEFSFVILTMANQTHFIPLATQQTVLAAVLLSMLLAPFLIQRSDRIVRRFCSSEWLMQATHLHTVAVQAMGTDNHVILCGYGRSGQNLARFLEQESISFFALDLDPERVKEAAAGGDSVVFGDAGKREVLIAAGLMRAKALIVTYDDFHSTLKILAHTRELRPELPVIVRTLDDSNLDKLKEAGAAEIVVEIMETSLMLASHTLMQLGIPLNRVLKRVRQAREESYSLFRGFFPGITDEALELSEKMQTRLHSVFIPKGAAAVSKTLGELSLNRYSVEVKAVRRRNIKGLAPTQETRLEAGDVVVLLGLPENLASAEMVLLQG